MKTAFLFPGQGAQVVGMGKDIVDAFPSAAKIFNAADNILGYDLSSICFEGPAEKLNTTTISQPAIFATSAAILEVLRTSTEKNNFRANITAGLSLGEYTALYAAGVISFEEALKLVQKRGQAMQQASDANEGMMVGIIGLDEDKVKQICMQASETEVLEAVNFNCPGQIVVSGTKSACEHAQKLATEGGALKTIRLDVAGAFHTKMMADAADALKQALQTVEISTPSDTNIIANINAEYYKTAEDIKNGLIKQLTCPIFWQKCMEQLLADKVEKFYEIGPGRVLTALMKRINRRTKVINLSTLDAVKQLL